MKPEKSKRKGGNATGVRPKRTQFYLVVPCRDEDFQRELYEELRGRGLRCRVLSL